MCYSEHVWFRSHRFDSMLLAQASGRGRKLHLLGGGFRLDMQTERRLRVRLRLRRICLARVRELCRPLSSLSLCALLPRASPALCSGAPPVRTAKYAPKELRARRSHFHGLGPPRPRPRNICKMGGDDKSAAQRSDSARALLRGKVSGGSRAATCAGKGREAVTAQRGRRWRCAWHCPHRGHSAHLW